MDQLRDCLHISSLCLLRGDGRKKNNQAVFLFTEWGCDELGGKNSQTWWGHACELVYCLPPHTAVTPCAAPIGYWPGTPLQRRYVIIA